MPIPTYTPGYPPDGSSLGQTKSTIRNNLDGTFQTLGVDHVNNNGSPGGNPAGYHTVIHQVPQTNVTTDITVNQVFSGVPGTLVVDGTTTPFVPNNGDVQLYSLTRGGVLAQLTGLFRNSNGYCWAGGILFQWGTFSMAANLHSKSISYPINFPTNVFMPAVIGSTSNDPAQVAGVNLSASDKTQFTAYRTGNGNLNYTYIAIGN
jgi:hypothetical protein